jgi:hypothetical protein
VNDGLRRCVCVCAWGGGGMVVVCFDHRSAVFNFCHFKKNHCNINGYIMLVCMYKNFLRPSSVGKIFSANVP